MNPPINVSVLTSFSALGLKNSLRYLPELEVDYIELYAFMQADMEWLQTINPVPGAPRNVVHYLAEAKNLPNAEVRLADDICQRIGKLKISSLATFMPEIMSHDPETVGKAQDALVFLIRLIRELNKRNHPVLTLEIVGGSALGGVWYADNTAAKEKSFAVNRLLPGGAITQLLEALDKSVVDEALKSPTVVLSVEMEPGCLFTVGSGDGILEFCSGVVAVPSRRKCLALNLDIPHWAFIHSLTRDWVLDNPVVKERIAHAHISDHFIGHFADSFVCAHHKEEEFWEWISLLSSLDRRTPENQGYSGFLTLELEGCFNIKHVKRSIAKMQELIALYSQ